EPGLPAKEEKEDLALFKPDTTQVAVKNPFLQGAKPQEAARPGGRVLAVPAARKLARELGIPIEEVPGSGPLGRVRVEDVRA
ncbi:E3 binding domain-containing protein, partial [Shewanella sp. C31]|nr:E3 binding domain-containing protein [Shewanella electrica]